MPSFCRHNHLIQNCPICSREQAVELRPVLSSSAPRSTQPREPRPSTPRGARSRAARPAQRDGVRVRRLARGADDGYRSPLAAGLRSSADAERLADEIGFSVQRLNTLEHTPPGLYAEVADPAGELEERTWLAFLIAYLGPLDEPDPFASIERVRTPWTTAQSISLADPTPGPRGAHDPGHGQRTVAAYRAWAARAGSQAAAFSGEPSWSAERRFERVFERMALPGMSRDARFDLLVTLGRLGLYELRAGKLALVGENEVTVAAKRVFGIGDQLLLERRGAELAAACAVPLDALDLALFNWGRGAGFPDGPSRATGGLGTDAEPDADAIGRARAALGV